MAGTRSTPPLVLWLRELGLDDVPRVGGKNASLGEMVQKLGARGVRVPNGFALTAHAYRLFLAEAGLDREIERLLDGLDTRDVPDLRRRGRAVRQAILGAALPDALRRAIEESYASLSREAGEDAVDVAVRSSATAEDLPDASFAGQQETYLNVHGAGSLVDACRRCFASLFTDRAISYREERSFDPRKVALSVGVQRMVRSDLASSGVMFSIDTETGFENAVLINAAWGLGENVVQGSVNPDEYYVFKPTLKQGKRPILQKSLGSKEMKLIYAHGGGESVRNVPVSREDQQRFALDDDEILELARWAVIIEDHYSAERKQKTPMDIEWAKDGHSGELFIVQARPETVQSRREAGVLETWRLKEKGRVLVEGRAVGSRIAAGPVQVIKDAREIERFKPGSVLVTDMTDPDWEPVMKSAAAIVTNRGGRTCHAAIVSRELGLPAIVGTGDATRRLEDGADVTISCAEGDVGHVYEGKLEFETRRIKLDEHRRPQTRMMMNVGNPEEAFALSFLPNDGVGLAREEFIINNSIGIHPLALLHPEKVTSAEARRRIEEMTAGYPDKAEFFVERLAHGVGMIGAAFWPNDVIVRLSDFKTNEYAGLVGGEGFEPREDNPMIGWRGASRYYDDRYRDGFALECRALKRVRDDMGLTNVKVMVPFCRTVEEGRRVQEELARHGLVRGENGLELYVMCEIPSNVILAERFAEVFDGFSIGSNDLTQLTLGVDRDSEIVAPLFDERDEAVKAMLRMVIRAAKKAGRKIGICGQAPSDYPEIARFLVEEGIDSISLTPDAIVRTTVNVLEVEQQLQRKPR